MAENRETKWLDAWYGSAGWTLWLLPLAFLYRLVSALRRFILIRFFQQSLSVPVIVVGNITVGGTGKTPLLIALVKHLQKRGFNPGVISRGYGGRASSYPLLLNQHSVAAEVGDEPLTIFRQTGCPVCVGPDRVADAETLIAAGCNIILSDDGLQHYRLGRNIEIVVVDGVRGFGNGYPIPVGPLREPVARLANADLIVVNSRDEHSVLPGGFAYHDMQIVPLALQVLATQQQLAVDYFPPATRLHAVAGIGNPERFFQTLQQLQLRPVPHKFPDHHNYVADDFIFSEILPVVMTEKDAVKCQSFADENWYALLVRAKLNDRFYAAFDSLVDSSLHSRY